MKLKFKTQTYQTTAVQTVVDCFKCQPPANVAAMKYTIPQLEFVPQAVGPMSRLLP